MSSQLTYSVDVSTSKGSTATTTTTSAPIDTASLEAMLSDPTVVSKVGAYLAATGAAPGAVIQQPLILVPSAGEYEYISSHNTQPLVTRMHILIHCFLSFLHLVLLLAPTNAPTLMPSSGPTLALPTLTPSAGSGGSSSSSSGSGSSSSGSGSGSGGSGSGSSGGTTSSSSSGTGSSSGSGGGSASGGSGSSSGGSSSGGSSSSGSSDSSSNGSSGSSSSSSGSSSGGSSTSAVLTLQVTQSIIGLDLLSAQQSAFQTAFRASVVQVIGLAGTSHLQHWY